MRTLCIKIIDLNHYEAKGETSRKLEASTRGELEDGGSHRPRDDPQPSLAKPPSPLITLLKGFGFPEAPGLFTYQSPPVFCELKALGLPVSLTRMYTLGSGSMSALLTSVS